MSRAGGQERTHKLHLRGILHGFSGYLGVTLVVVFCAGRVVAVVVTPPPAPPPAAARRVRGSGAAFARGGTAAPLPLGLAQVEPHAEHRQVLSAHRQRRPCAELTDVNRALVSSVDGRRPGNSLVE